MSTKLNNANNEGRALMEPDSDLAGEAPLRAKRPAASVTDKDAAAAQLSLF